MASLTPSNHDNDNHHHHNEEPLPTTPATIHPSQSELLNARLSPRNLELAIHHLHRDGLVVVADVIPHADLNALNAKMVQDALYLRSLGDKGPFNYNLGNLQQDPPPVAEYFFKSIFTSPRPKWTFCSANSAMPPDPSTPDPTPQRQPVHSDADFNHPSHPFALVINIPLVKMTPSNGSTELWLGTHAPYLLPSSPSATTSSSTTTSTSSSVIIPSGIASQETLHGDRASGRIKPHLLSLRRAVRGPSQPTIEKGSIVIRDLRLWHAGMPNTSSDVRVMLAMIHFAAWYRNPMRLQFAEDVRPLLLEEAENELEMPVDWTTREEALRTYLGRGFGNSYDFDQEK
ncbi:hypothetical protein SGCOL_002050 [Colletotrichum sp. CLE4]